MYFLVVIFSLLLLASQLNWVVAISRKLQYLFSTTAMKSAIESSVLAAASVKIKTTKEQHSDQERFDSVRSR